MKTCNQCGETKPLSEYHKHQSSRDGYNSECAACARLKVSAYRAAHRDEINARRRKKVEDYKLKGRAIKPPDGMKYCPKCDKIMSVDEFYLEPTRHDKRKAYCRGCARKHAREHYPSTTWRPKWLQRMYGITVAEYEHLLASQGGVCKICGKPQTARRRASELLSVDHDHSTGAIRGLLCDTCNRGLGHFNDDPALLARAIEYLNRSRSASDRSA